jgi:chromosome segregation ATPase
VVFAAQPGPAPTIPPEEPAALDADCQAFVDGLNQHAVALRGSQSKVLEIESSLHNLEQRQSDALQRDQFDVAESLNQQISRAHAALLQARALITGSVTSAMTLASGAPDRLLTHAAKSQNELPQLRVRKSGLDKRLAQLVDDQNMDRQTIEIERKKNASTIDALERPIREHRQRHEALISAMESSLANAKRPFQTRIADLTAERDSHNARIEELLAEIEQHRIAVRNLETQITMQEIAAKRADEAFNPKRAEIARDMESLKTEAAEYDHRVREIEAPFQSLVDQTEKRDTEINAVTAAVEKIRLQIEESELDATQCESAAALINQLCKEHFSYLERRTRTTEKFDAAGRQAVERDKRRSAINAETIALRGKCQQASEFLIEAKAKRPQLEAAKKAAVVSKNFKGASQISQELNKMIEKIDTNERLVTQTSAKLEQLEQEVADLTSEIASAQVEAEEARVSMLNIDHEFFTQAVKELKGLFELSPYGEKLLSPLLEMLQFALEHTELPKEMTKEEIDQELEALNDKLQEAIGEDDFDTAAQLQEKIDRLTAKLEKFQQS